MRLFKKQKEEIGIASTFMSDLLIDCGGLGGEEKTWSDRSLQ